MASMLSVRKDSLGWILVRNTCYFVSCLGPLRKFSLVSRARGRNRGLFTATARLRGGGNPKGPLDPPCIPLGLWLKICKRIDLEVFCCELYIVGARAGSPGLLQAPGHCRGSSRVVLKAAPGIGNQRRVLLKALPKPIFVVRAREKEFEV